MGFFDELKKLTRPYDEEEPFLDEDAQPEKPEKPEKPKPNPFTSRTVEPPPAAPTAQSTPAPPPVQTTRAARQQQKEGKVVSLGGGGQMQVVLMKPEKFESAAEVADHLRSNRAVLVNMEGASKELTRRLVDFLSGVTYAMNGNIRKVASNTYILTPPNVNLMGNLMDELETSGMYF